MLNNKSALRRMWVWIRFGTITCKVVDRMEAWGRVIPTEIEYRGRWNRVIGYWAYGQWHPAYPYRGY